MPDNNQKIELEEYDSEHVTSLYNKLFNDERLVRETKANGNCQCYAVIQAVKQKAIKYTTDTENLVAEMRKTVDDSGFHTNGEGKRIKDDGVWFDGWLAFFAYKKIANNKDFSYTVIKPQRNLPDEVVLPSVMYTDSDKNDSSFRGMFINLKNGGPAIIAQNRHYRTINWENRDEFCLKLLKLIMYRDIYRERKRENDYDIKSYFSARVKEFFQVNDKDTIRCIREFLNNFDEILDNVEER